MASGPSIDPQRSRPAAPHDTDLGVTNKKLIISKVVDNAGVKAAIANAHKNSHASKDVKMDSQRKINLAEIAALNEIEKANPSFTNDQKASLASIRENLKSNEFAVTTTKVDNENFGVLFAGRADDMSFGPKDG